MCFHRLSAFRMLLESTLFQKRINLNTALYSLCERSSKIVYVCAGKKNYFIPARIAGNSEHVFGIARILLFRFSILYSIHSHFSTLHSFRSRNRIEQKCSKIMQRKRWKNAQMKKVSAQSYTYQKALLPQEIRRRNMQKLRRHRARIR